MFSDIESHWASECIMALARRELIRGYPNGSFRPKAVVSRAEFAALLPRIFSQVPAGMAAIAFRDVPVQYWASSAIEWASQRGLISGYEDGTFRPRQTISRVQAVTVLIAGLDAMQTDSGIAESGNPNPDLPLDSPLNVSPDRVSAAFSDANQIPAYATAKIAAALDRQLLEKLESSRPLRPNQPITRGEVAALLCRTLKIPAEELTRRYPALIAAKDQQMTFEAFLAQEAGFDALKLAFLDSGIRQSPYRGDVASYPLRLQSPSDLPAPMPASMPAPEIASYPLRGEPFLVKEGGLDFLSPDILSGCLCLSTVLDGELQVRWLGREALRDRQLWSATKFIPLLNVAARANSFSPTTPIDRCWV
ncbi:MAG: S-layer homology domain-containing protein, partial [Phormidesmis sp.]